MDRTGFDRAYVQWHIEATDLLFLSNEPCEKAARLKNAKRLHKVERKENVVDEKKVEDIPSDLIFLLVFL